MEPPIATRWHTEPFDPDADDGAMCHDAAQDQPQGTEATTDGD